MLCKIMAPNCGSKFLKFSDFCYIYGGFIFFSFWIRNLRKLQTQRLQIFGLQQEILHLSPLFGTGLIIV